MLSEQILAFGFTRKSSGQRYWPNIKSALVQGLAFVAQQARYINSMFNLTIPRIYTEVASYSVPPRKHETFTECCVNVGKTLGAFIPLCVHSLLTLTTLKYLCANHGDQRVFSV